MAPEKHAILGASSAHRWINCPPSALLNALLPDETSPFAEEGTKAHAWCEYLLNQALELPAERPEFEADSEMLEAAQGYRDFVLEKIITMDPGVSVFVEQRVDYSPWAPDGFGTVDCMAVSGSQLKIFDFKYGQGVEVSADWNPQMLCYALGGLHMLDPLYEIYDIELCIYQPRRGHISTFSMTLPELYGWAADTLEPAAKLAAEGRGEAKAGDWCRFCKAKATCKTLAAQQLEIAKNDFRDPETLSLQDISRILPKLDLLVDWAKELKDFALSKALGGAEIPGYKLVEGRSVRRFRSEADACLRIKEAGFNPYITKMKGLTDLQKEMGRKSFDEICGDLLEKPAGKPVLVPASDKRPVMAVSAADDFALPF